MLVVVTMTTTQMARMIVIIVNLAFGSMRSVGFGMEAFPCVQESDTWDEMNECFPKPFELVRPLGIQFAAVLEFMTVAFSKVYHESKE